MQYELDWDSCKSTTLAGEEEAIQGFHQYQVALLIPLSRRRKQSSGKKVNREARTACDVDVT